MKKGKHPRFAQGEPPEHPRYVWDAMRHCWVEAITRIRLTDGRFGRKDGSEPQAQLVLFPDRPN
jgi:hypothetical protein